MACHEIAALRLGMMNVLGIEDEAEKQHELNEIGQATLATDGPIRSLSQANNFNLLRKLYDACLSDLELRVSRLNKDDSKLPYYRSLLILTKKVEFDLKNSVQALENLFRDLEEMHDFVHEVYPSE